MPLLKNSCTAKNLESETRTRLETTKKLLQNWQDNLLATRQTRLNAGGDFIYQGFSATHPTLAHLHQTRTSKTLSASLTSCATPFAPPGEVFSSCQLGPMAPLRRRLVGAGLLNCAACLVPSRADWVSNLKIKHTFWAFESILLLNPSLKYALARVRLGQLAQVGGR